MDNPAMFIGSSKEGLRVARAIQVQLHEDADVRLWNEGVFEISKSYLDSLIKALNTFQLAVFIFRAEDKLVSRDTGYLTVRGNVLFEFGLFMGKLGPSRTFVVYDADNTPSFISDLTGIAFAPYHGKSNSNLLTAVSSACYIIREAVRRVQDENFQNRLTISCSHPAMLSYCQYIDSIYKSNFRGIGKHTPLETIILQATRVYEDIFNTNCRIGLWKSEKQFDHTLVSLIVGWIKDNIENCSVTTLSNDKLAGYITERIFSYLKASGKG